MMMLPYVCTLCFLVEKALTHAVWACCFPSSTSPVPRSCLNPQQAFQEESQVPLGAGGWYILDS